MHSVVLGGVCVLSVVNLWCVHGVCVCGTFLCGLHVVCLWEIHGVCGLLCMVYMVCMLYMFGMLFCGISVVSGISVTCVVM